jgi:hypothetical protein
MARTTYPRGWRPQVRPVRVVRPVAVAVRPPVVAPPGGYGVGGYGVNGYGR